MAAGTVDDKWISPKGAAQLANTVLDVSTGQKVKLRSVFAGYEAIPFDLGLSVSDAQSLANMSERIYYNSTQSRLYYVSTTKTSNQYNVHVWTGTISSANKVTWTSNTVLGNLAEGNANKVYTNLLYSDNKNPVLLVTFVPYSTRSACLFYPISSGRGYEMTGGNVNSSSTSHFFITSTYWGYIYRNSTDLRIYAASLYTSPSAYYGVTLNYNQNFIIIGSYKQYFYYMITDSTKSQSAQLVKLNLGTRTVESTETLTGMYAIGNGISDGTNFYAFAIGTNGKYGSKLFKLAWEDGVTNGSSIVYSFDAGNWDPGIYAGDVSSKGIFFKRPYSNSKTAYYAEINYSTLAFKVYTLNVPTYIEMSEYKQPLISIRLTRNDAKNQILQIGDVALDIKNACLYPAFPVSVPSTFTYSSTGGSNTTRKPSLWYGAGNYMVLINPMGTSLTKNYAYIVPQSKNNIDDNITLIVGGNPQYLYLSE